MIDPNVSAVLHLSKDGQQSLCVAKLRQEGDRIYASPTLVAPAFAQFTGAEVDETGLELMPGTQGTTSFYHYRRLINLGDGIHSEYVTNLE
jgi:hypothetical protein